MRVEEKIGRRAMLAAIGGVASLFVGGCAKPEVVIATFTIGPAQAGRTLHGAVVRAVGLPALRYPSRLGDGTSGFLVAGFTAVTVDGYEYDPGSPFGHEVERLEGRHWVRLRVAWDRIVVLQGERYRLIESSEPLTRSQDPRINEADRVRIQAEEDWGMSFRQSV